MKVLSKTLTFKGGIHPPYFKELSSHKAIEDCPLPEKVIIPLRQHRGHTCEPLVQKGDTVQAGQKIASSNQFISAPIHASVSGKVLSIEPKREPTGEIIPSIIIKTDTENQEVVKLKPLDDNASDQEIIERVKETGIVGLGGSAFPAHAKLQPPKEHSIKTLIANGCECEPFLTSDHRQMVEEADELIDGIKLEMKVIGAEECIIAVEDNKADCLAILVEKTKDISSIGVQPVATKYPQGESNVLVKTILGLEVPHGIRTTSIGVMVQNVGTIIAISKAVRKGEALTHKVVTISGAGVKTPKNLRAPIGIPARDLINAAGGFSVSEGRVIFGGPMTGFVQFDLEAPLVKGSAGMTVIPEKQAESYKFEPCIRCARCVDVCPMGLIPSQLSILSELGYYERLEELYVSECMECGCCTYVCPGKRPIVNHIKLAKYKLKG